MITEKPACKKWQFIEAVVVTFAVIVFVFFVNTIYITTTISSHSVTEVSAILFDTYYFYKYIC